MFIKNRLFQIEEDFTNEAEEEKENKNRCISQFEDINWADPFPTKEERKMKKHK